MDVANDLAAVQGIYSDETATHFVGFVLGNSRAPDHFGDSLDGRILTGEFQFESEFRPFRERLAYRKSDATAADVDGRMSSAPSFSDHFELNLDAGSFHANILSGIGASRWLMHVQ